LVSESRRWEYCRRRKRDGTTQLRKSAEKTAQSETVTATIEGGKGRSKKQKSTHDGQEESNTGGGGVLSPIGGATSRFKEAPQGTGEPSGSLKSREDSSSSRKTKKGDGHP